MPSATSPVEPCPCSAPDKRKSARIVGPGGVKLASPVTGYAAVRDALRAAGSQQAGFKAELINRGGSPIRPPILFLTGEAHRRQRAATARFFSPRALADCHRPIMEACADRLMGELRQARTGRLDAMALDMAVTVAGQIVGLTDSDKLGMIRRLDAFFSMGGGTAGNRLSWALLALRGQWRMLRFYLNDVRPAIAARRKALREDVISHLISEGYKNSDILVECLTYGAAGMVTTREFITMAGWHLLEDDGLRARFLLTDGAGRLAILEEILRLEPVVGTLYRKPPGADTPLALDIRSANGDPQAVGECPFSLSPDRERAERVGGAGMAFGDGEHRCPGAGVAMAEAEIFLDRLLRIPGLRLARAPDMSWNPLVTGYELRGCELLIEEMP